MQVDLTNTEKVALAIYCADTTRQPMVGRDEAAALMRRSFERAYQFLDISKEYNRNYK